MLAEIDADVEIESCTAHPVPRTPHLWYTSDYAAGIGKHDIGMIEPSASKYSYQPDTPFVMPPLYPPGPSAPVIPEHLGLSTCASSDDGSSTPASSGAKQARGASR